MKLKLVNKKKNKISFEVIGNNVGYVNTLRRIFMVGVPTMAISSVEFKNNSSSIYDEMLAHRLGLIPFKTDLKSYNVAKPDAEESPATHLKITLQESGPKVVYASDMKSKDSKVVPVFPETPIVELLDGQELEFVATARLGVGSEHSKWNTGLVSYYYNPKIKVNNKSPKLEKFINKYPPQVKTKGTIDASKINTPELIDACGSICEDIVKMEYDVPHKDFVFTIESYEQLTPKEIVEEGMLQYDAQLDEFNKLLKQL